MFKTQSLKTFAGLLAANRMSDIPLVWLLDCGAQVNTSDLDMLKSIGGAGIGPHKSLLIPHVYTPGVCLWEGLCSWVGGCWCLY